MAIVPLRMIRQNTVPLHMRFLQFLRLQHLLQKLLLRAAAMQASPAVQAVFRACRTQLLTAVRAAALPVSRTEPPPPAQLPDCRASRPQLFPSARAQTLRAAAPQHLLKIQAGLSPAARAELSPAARAQVSPAMPVFRRPPKRIFRAFRSTGSRGTQRPGAGLPDLPLPSARPTVIFLRPLLFLTGAKAERTRRRNGN